MSKFYTFKQNNSGAKYIGPKYIIVEACSVVEANKIGQENGVDINAPFCNCCGRRWDLLQDWCEEDATDSPAIYGKPVVLNDNVKIVYKEVA